MNYSPHHVLIVAVCWVLFVGTLALVFPQVRQPVVRRSRILWTARFVAIPLAVALGHLALGLLVGIPDPVNKAVSHLLQIVGAWIVFLSVADSAGYLDKQRLLADVSEFLRYFFAGKRVVGASVQAQSATIGVSTGAASIGRVRRQSVSERLDDLERDVERIDAERIQVEQRLTKKIDEGLRAVRESVGRVRDEVDILRTRIESETEKFFRVELAGILLFTHGLLVSWVA
ncbi:MAG: hypothetical protein AAFY29_03180 [Pseudomonadota bacterium]